MAVKKIDIVGSDWTYLNESSRLFLVELMGKILYGQLDKATSLLMETDQQTLKELKKAAYRLNLSCDVVGVE